MERTLGKLNRALSLKSIGKAVKNPNKVINFVDGTRASFKKDRMDMEIERRELSKRLADVFDKREEVISEYQKEIEENESFYDVFNSKKDDLRKADVLSGTTSTLDAQTMYVVCRIIEPNVVIESGCRYGSFDAHIAAALNKNDNGVMYSIDLPDAIEKYDYGYLVPDKYKERWNFRLGDAKDILPKLLEDEGPPDIFLHDSLHTRSHMRWEYETAYPKIADNGVLASHDVLKSNVFRNFANSKNMDWTRIRNIGVAQK